MESSTSDDFAEALKKLEEDIEKEDEARRKRMEEFWNLSPEERKKQLEDLKKESEAMKKEAEARRKRMEEFWNLSPAVIARRRGDPGSHVRESYLAYIIK